MVGKSRYSSIVERLFALKYAPGAREVAFERDDIVACAHDLGIRLPKNLGDVVYSFRYRQALPKSVRATAQEGQAWIIRGAGTGRCRFALVTDRPIIPNESIVTTKIPDATPGIIAKYALSDEQALLAKLRYNRLVDVFSGVTCYSLQNHLRTHVPDIGQVETDELYVGVDKKGSHYILPVQAKAGRDSLSVVQIEQDLALCAHRFRSLICRPLAAQFIRNDVIVMFELEQDDEGVGIVTEKHYEPGPPDDVTEADLESYRRRTAA